MKLIFKKFKNGFDVTINVNSKAIEYILLILLLKIVFPTVEFSEIISFISNILV